METDTLTRVPTARDLTAFDRCDRCGAQGFVLAQKLIESRGESEIIFCGHHGREHTPALASKGWTVHDFSHLINVKPTDPSDD